MLRANADTLHCFREIFSDIDEQVSAAEELLAAGNATVLTGIPVAIKDNIMFAGHIAVQVQRCSSTIVQVLIPRLYENSKKQARYYYCRTNMDEFAMGSSTENSAYGVTKNPT